MFQHSRPVSRTSRQAFAVLLLLLAAASHAPAQSGEAGYPTPVFSGGQQLAPWICARTVPTPVTVSAPRDSSLTGTATTRASRWIMWTTSGGGTALTRIMREE